MNYAPEDEQFPPHSRYSMHDDYHNADTVHEGYESVFAQQEVLPDVLKDGQETGEEDTGIGWPDSITGRGK